MRNRVPLKFLLRTLNVLAFCSLGSASYAKFEIFSSQAEIKSGITQDELEVFLGDWHLAKSDLVLSIEKLTPSGEWKLKAYSEEDILVKRVNVSRFVGQIPLLTIETELQGQAHGVFCLMREGTKLVGTYDHVPSGKSVDVSLVSKEPVKVSLSE